MDKIKLINVSKYADAKKKTPILNKINLDISSGETLALIGPVNSGKTSLLRAVAGLLTIDEGEIYFDNRLISGEGRQEKIGALFEHHFLYKTGWSGLLAAMRPRRWTKQIIRERLMPIKKLMDLKEEELTGKLVRRLSKGEQQRLDIARYLLTQKKVFLLDDPFAAMDVIIRGKMKSALKEVLQELKVTTILITQFNDEALYLADKTAVMHSGIIEQVGGKELIENPATNFVREYLK